MVSNIIPERAVSKFSSFISIVHWLYGFILGRGKQKWIVIRKTRVEMNVYRAIKISFDLI